MENKRLYRHLDRKSLDSLQEWLGKYKRKHTEDEATELQAGYFPHRYQKGINRFSQFLTLEIPAGKRTFDEAYLEGLFVTVLDIGLLDETSEDVDSAFSGEGSMYFITFCEVIAENFDVNNPQHFDTLMQLRDIDSFLMIFYSQLDEETLRIVSRKLDEMRVSYRQQIDTFMNNSLVDDGLFDEKEFGVIKTVAVLGGIDMMDLAKKYDVIAEFYEENV